MANGIGRVWAANAGDDEQRPNGVGSVWIENIDALAPSGGASEQQINDLSAAIDYVSANAGDPNALTGYQYAGEISSTSGSFVARGADGGYVINTNPGFIDVSGNGYELHVGEAGHLTANYGASARFTNGSQFYNTNNNFISGDGSHGFVTSSNYHDLRIENAGKISANNNASAVFTNGSLVSADSNNGFLVSYGVDRFISAVPWGLRTKNGPYDIKADNYGIEISSYYSNMPFKYETWYKNITLANSNGFDFEASANNHSAWIDDYGAYGLSGSNYLGSFGRWDNNGISWNPNGVGFSSSQCNFGVYNGGTLIANNYCKLSATNGSYALFNNTCSAVFTNGSRTEITNAHALFVGNNELGSMNGILVSGNGTPYISIYNGGKVKVIDGNEVSLSGITHKIGNSLNASGSQFVSADGEGVSAWKPAPMTVMGMYNQTSSNAAFVIGNGSTSNARSDLFVIDYSGNAKSNDFVAEQAPIVHTVTGELTATQGGSDYYYDPILSSDLGVDLTKVSISVDFSELNNGSLQSMNYRGLGSTAENNWYAWNNKDTFKQNFEQPFSTSSTFTGYSFIEGDPTSLTSVSSIDFVLDTNITIPYTATWVEEVAPKSLTELYNAFTAYTASHP